MASNLSTEEKERKEFEELQELEQLTQLAEQEEKQKQQFQEGLAASLLESGKEIGSQALTAGEQLSSAALSAATLGLSERPVAAMQAAIGGVPTEQMIERRRQMQVESPLTEMAGQFAGGLTGASGLAGKAIAGTVGETAARLGETKAAQVIGKTLGPLAGPASTIAQGAAAGVMGAPVAAAQMGVEQLSGLRKPEEVPSIGEIAATGAKFGAGAPAALMTAGLLGRGAKAAGSMAMTTLLGPNEAVRKAYLKQPEEVTAMINEADRRARINIGEVAETGGVEEGEAVLKGKPRTQVAERITAATEPKRAELAALEKQQRAAILSKDEARAEFDEAVKVRIRQLKDELELATETAQDAKNKKRDFFKSGLSEELEKDVKVSVEDLKSDVIRGSQRSYVLLDEAPGEANLKSIDLDISALKDELKTGGKILGPVKERVAQIIDYWANGIGEIIGTKVPGIEGRVDAPGNIPFPTVKKIVQDIDTQLGYMSAPENRGKFSELDRSYLLRIRKIIDSNIKPIRGYAALMEDVAYKRELLEDVSNLIGDEKKVNFLSRLNKSWIPGDPAQDIIVRLGRTTGRDFESALVDYAAAKQIGASQEQLTKALRELPESVERRRLAKALEIAREKESAPSLAPEKYASWVKSQQDVDAINFHIDRVKSELAEIGSAGSEKTAVNFVQESMRGINPKLKSEISALTKMTGQDFERQIRAAATAEALMGTYPGGSRRTVVFQNIGKLFGADKSIGFASTLGASLDVFGGRVTKQLLDGYLKVQGIPTVQKLSAAFAPLPKSLKAEILSSFTRSVMQSERQSVPLSDQEVAVAKMEIRNSDHLSPLEKARATMMLDKTGILDTGIAQKVMLSGMASNTDEGRARAYNAIRAGER